MVIRISGHPDDLRQGPTATNVASFRIWLNLGATLLHGVFHGRTFQEIADSIHRTRAAVESHWRRVKEKLDAESITDAIHRVYAEVLIPMRVKAATELATTLLLELGFCP